MNRTPIVTALAAGTLLAITACTSTGGKSGAPVSSQSAAGASATPSPTATTTAERVAAWWNNTGKADVVTLSHDMIRAGKTMQSPSADPTPMLDQISQVATDVSHAQQDAPVPDPTAQAQWTTALHAYDVALTDLETAANSNNQALLDKSAPEMSAAETDLAQAVRTIERIAAGG